MSTHTKGPWRAICPPSSALTHRFIVAERESFHEPVLAEVGSRMTCDDGVSIFESAANARLIAAAPDLLEALEAMIKGVAVPVSDHPWAAKRRAAHALANAAIAKAKGNS